MEHLRSVEDADAVAAAVADAGGTVIAEPMDVMDLGRMASADPEGAVFGIWQAGTFVGAGWSTRPTPWSGTSSTPAT